MISFLIGYCIFAYIVHGWVSFSAFKQEGKISGLDAVWLLFAPLSLILYVFTLLGLLLSKP